MKYINVSGSDPLPEGYANQLPLATLKLHGSKQQQWLAELCYDEQDVAGSSSKDVAMTSKVRWTSLKIFI
ncbi:hypothetical protein HHI36_005535 [Cryptolaemus montrouzieri]|uniref:Uncharacterized protein n=1 Tax=Cryptolaemus montrouzieri TaxID=559131 RepID=A0ABD2NUG4_9CUCU